MKPRDLRSTARIMLCAALLSLAQPLGSPSVWAQEKDWPAFRGPNRDGTARARGLPVEWSETKNIVWKTPLPGPGASSPVTFGDRIYLTCYSGYGLSRESRGNHEDLKRHVVCLSRAGKILWDKSFASDVGDDRYGDFMNRHGYASSTPAVDATGVYTFFGPWGARAYSHTGELKWESSCGTRYSNFGSGASPVLYRNLVIINAAVEAEALLALDKTTGREVWRIPYPRGGQSRSTPLLLENGDTPELVFHFGESYEGGRANPSLLGAVDPGTGKALWQCASVNAYLNPSPVASDGIIYAIANGAVAIRAGGKGDVTDTHLLWKVKPGSEVSSPVFHDGHLYWANEEGIAHCLNASSGDVVYMERLDPSPGPIYASAVAADGKLYYVSRENGTYVLAAEPRFRLLAHNTIAGDTSVFNASPAISRGQLLLRSDTHLYCIGKK